MKRSQLFPLMVLPVVALLAVAAGMPTASQALPLRDAPRLTPTPCAMGFTDVRSTDWHYQYVRYLYCTGSISGYYTNPPCDTGVPCFKPNNNSTRGQMAKILVLAFHMPVNVSGGPHFLDVSPGNTFYPYVETLCNAGVLCGSGQAGPAAEPEPLVASGQAPGDDAKHIDRGRPSTPHDSLIIPGAPITAAVSGAGNYGVSLNGQDQVYQDGLYHEYHAGPYMWVPDPYSGAVTVYGPPLPSGTDSNPYTTLSHALTGQGTRWDPYKVTTLLGVGQTPLQLTQQVSYVNGDDYVQLNWSICNTGAQSYRNVHLFHVVDLKTANQDAGYGYHEAVFGSTGGTTTDRTLYQVLMPGTQIAHFEENNYETIWRAVGGASGPGTGFRDVVYPDTSTDNATGMEWVFYEIAPGGPGCVSTYDAHAFVRTASNWVPLNHPQNNSTRGQIAKTVSIVSGLVTGPTDQLFEDVPSSSPFFTWINALASRGIISGYPCGGPNEPCVPPGYRPYYRPYNNTTRAQISKMIYLAVTYIPR